MASVFAAIASVIAAHFRIVTADSIMADSVTDERRMRAWPAALGQLGAINHSRVLTRLVAAVIIIIPNHTAIKGCAERINAGRVSLERSAIFQIKREA
jgi:hypothetical protein